MDVPNEEISNSSIIQEVAGKQVTKKRRRPRPTYNNFWEEEPEFEGWLMSKAGGTKAFCKICDKELYCHRVTILKHGCSLRHVKNKKLVDSISHVVDESRVMAIKNENIENGEGNAALEDLNAVSFIVSSENSCNNGETSNASHDTFDNMTSNNVPLGNEVIDESRVMAIKNENIEDSEGNAALEDLNAVSFIVSSENSCSNGETSSAGHDTFDNVTSHNAPSGNEFVNHAENSRDGISLNAGNGNDGLISNGGGNVMKFGPFFSIEVYDQDVNTPLVALSISLYILGSEKWNCLAEGLTDENGRFSVLLNENFLPGCYKFHVDCQEYSERQNIMYYSPFVEIPFMVRNSEEEHRITLTLTHNSYVVYRSFNE